MAYEYKKINYELIELDTYNPRLPTSLHNKSENDILEYMIMHGDVLSLIESIGESGFFPGEPIIIIKNGKNYKVIEGNRRLSAIKLINNPNLAPVLEDRIKESVSNIKKEILITLNEVYCLIAETDIEINKVDKFLGFRHITGTKNWKSLERARYLSKLFNKIKAEDEKLSNIEIYKDLAKTIGSKSDYIYRMLTGFEVYKKIEEKKFFHINSGGLNDQNFPFVNIADSLNRSKISSFLGVDLKKDNPLEDLDIENLETWAKWLYEKESGKPTRIKGTSGQLGLLDKILAHDEAKYQFIEKDKSLLEASEYIDEKDILFQKLIKKAKISLLDSEKTLYSINEYDITLEEELKEIVSICKNLNTINNSKKEEEQTDEFKL